VLTVFVGAPSALCYQAGSRRGFRMSRRGETSPR
jgi:hypothetical protein